MTKLSVSTSFLALLALVNVASGQQAIYQQCGGIGWTGATTCVTGTTCQVLNSFYSQCLPAGTSTSPSSSTSSTHVTSTSSTHITSTTSNRLTSTTTSSASTPTGSTISGATDCIPAGQYTLCENLWGAASGVGSQSSTLISTSGNTVSWSTNYTWANGPNSVKSYANVESNTAKGIQLSAINTAPTSWTWSYVTESSGIRADVSYDIWLGAASVGSPASSASNYEIMIWLAGEGGIQPVGSQITTGTSIAGYSWNLWKGPNSNWEVYSFVSASGKINSFNVDLKAFFQYLITSQGVSSSQYVQSIQAGTEPFTGTAQLLTSSYSVALSTA